MPASSTLNSKEFFMPKPHSIPTKPSRLEIIADYALAIVLGVAIAFGLFVYVSWFSVFLTPLKA